MVLMLLAATSLAGLFAFSYEEELNVVDASGKRQGHWLITAGMLELKDDWQPPQVVSEGNYLNGYKTGVWTTYDRSGQKRVDESFEAGVRNGQSIIYYPDGKPLMQITWTKGRIDGPAKTFYPDGKVCEEGTWRFDYWQEEYRLFDRNGHLRVQELKPVQLLTE